MQIDFILGTFFGVFIAIIIRHIVDKRIRKEFMNWLEFCMEQGHNNIDQRG